MPVRVCMCLWGRKNTRSGLRGSDEGMGSQNKRTGGEVGGKQGP